MSARRPSRRPPSRTAPPGSRSPAAPAASAAGHAAGHARRRASRAGRLCSCTATIPAAAAAARPRRTAPGARPARRRAAPRPRGPSSTRHRRLPAGRQSPEPVRGPRRAAPRCGRPRRARARTAWGTAGVVRATSPCPTARPRRRATASRTPPGQAGQVDRRRGKPREADMGVRVDERRGDQRAVEVHHLVDLLDEPVGGIVGPEPRDLPVGHQHRLSERVGAGVHDSVPVQRCGVRRVHESAMSPPRNVAQHAPPGVTPRCTPPRHAGPGPRRVGRWPGWPATARPGHLVEQVDHLLGPPDEVACRQVGAAEHGARPLPAAQRCTGPTSPRSSGRSPRAVRASRSVRRDHTRTVASTARASRGPPGIAGAAATLLPARLEDDGGHHGGQLRGVQPVPRALPQALGDQEVVLRVQPAQGLPGGPVTRTSAVPARVPGTRRREHVADGVEHACDRAGPALDPPHQGRVLLREAVVALGPPGVVLALGAAVARVAAQAPAQLGDGGVVTGAGRPRPVPPGPLDPARGVRQRAAQAERQVAAWPGRCAGEAASARASGRRSARRAPGPRPAACGPCRSCVSTVGSGPSKPSVPGPAPPRARRDDRRRSPARRLGGPGELGARARPGAPASASRFRSRSRVGQAHGAGSAYSAKSPRWHVIASAYPASASACAGPGAPVRPPPGPPGTARSSARAPRGHAPGPPGRPG